MRRYLLAWLLCGIAAPAAAPAAPTLPSGFEQLVLASGIGVPTAIDWAPDGRMFVAEKPGLVRVVNPGTAPETSLVLDLSRRVNGYGDRGLLGLAVANDFARTGHVYLLYTLEINRRRQDGPKTARLTRITIGPDNHVRGRERVILGRDGSKPCRRLSNARDCIPANAAQHTIGTVRAAGDGTLWVGSGDAFGQNSRFDDVFHTSRAKSLAGKIIHIDRRGRGLPGHPFCRRDDDLTHTCTKVYAEGFRNPFRFTLDGKTPIVGDVGLEAREEIDVVLPGRDYGWPCYEGTIHTPVFALQPRCIRQYRAPERRSGPITPLFDYAGFPGAVVVGPVFGARSWPKRFRDRLYFGDYTRGFISTLDLDTGRDASFGTELGSPVAIERSPRGNLAYVDIAAGEVREIAYSPDNMAPVAQAVRSSGSGPVPLLVYFSARGSADPEGQPLTYHWSFGDGTTGSGRDVSHLYTTAGNFTVRMTVTDPAGRSAVKLLRVSPGNTQPRVEIVAPASGSLYTAGKTLLLHARATDPEDGRIPSRAIVWKVRLDHRGHKHFLLDGLRGRRAGFRVPTDHTADTFVVITATATDSGGLQHATAVAAYPRTANVTIESDPTGAPVTFGDGNATAPVSGEHAVGFETVLSTAPSFEHDGRRFRFARWSDGAARSHTVRVPEDGLALRAHYRQAD
ncbi:MAG TPA: PQQ-dependent sugar dehydrogenase [Thermoleophilaceae bacterium]|nr:PQQ-dependent sugar dehydrogenase [Thermoleophilaceae bacterium]